MPKLRLIGLLRVFSLRSIGRSGHLTRPIKTDSVYCRVFLLAKIRKKSRQHTPPLLAALCGKGEAVVSLAGFMNMDVTYPGISIKVELTVLAEYLDGMEQGISAVCDSYILKEEDQWGQSK